MFLPVCAQIMYYIYLVILGSSIVAFKPEGFRALKLVFKFAGRRGTKPKC